MISKIGIENFRIFKDFTNLELAPLTVLTGPNNSGKSSFLKLISILQHSSIGKKGLNVLNFDGGNHNLGTFSNVLNQDSNSKHIKIVLNFPLDYFEEDFDLELIYEKHAENGNLLSFKVFNNNSILFHYFNSFSIEHKYFTNESKNGFSFFYKLDFNYLKNLESKNKPKFKENLLFDYYLKEEEEESVLINEKYLDFFRAFENLYGKFYNGVTDDIQFDFETFTDAVSEIPYFNDDNLLTILHQQKLENNIINDISTEEIRTIILDAIDYDYFNDDAFLKDLPSIEVRLGQNEKLVKKYIAKNFEVGLKKIIYSLNNMDHLSASRGSKSRILSNKSTNEIDEITKEFNRIYHFDSRYSEFIKTSFKLLNIQGSIKIERLEGNASIIFLMNKTGKINLSDLGFGYAQIIPILFKIIINYHKVDRKRNNYPDNNDAQIYSKSSGETKKIFEISDFETYYLNLHKLKYAVLIIEEPEANLHPNLQSKLADVLVLAHKTFGIHFILETHSEYLIRKLQYLTAKKEIEKNEAVIYYFNSDEYVSSKEPKVKEIKIDEFGALTDSFGPGFYDEATSLKFDLMKLNKEQNN